MLDGGVGEKEQDFNQKQEVLVRYKILDEETNLLYKGKVTQKVSSVDSILLTELFFSGLFNELTDPECLALFSVMV